MQCPIDGTQLMISDRQGVEIDYCPKCRGVWLDRGELDKIIERSGNFSSEAQPGRGERSAPTHSHDDYEDRRYEEDRSYKKKKKKRGGFGDFLDDIFDF